MLVASLFIRRLSGKALGGTEDLTFTNVSVNQLFIAVTDLEGHRFQSLALRGRQAPVKYDGFQFRRDVIAGTSN